MSAPAAFGVVVRTVGLLVLVYGAFQLVTTLAIILTIGNDIVPVGMPLMMAAIGILAGAWLLRGAPVIQRFAYGDTGS